MKNPCRTCGTLQKHSDTYGCCSACGLLFKGLEAFDKHFKRADDGSPICQHPTEVLRWPGTERETNWFEPVPVPLGTAWRKALTPEERERQNARFAA